MIEWLGLEKGMAIEHKRVANGIGRAQKKVEERNFAIRKNLLEYDGIMDAQRKYFYTIRQEILEGRGIRQIILSMIEEAVAEAAKAFAADLAGAING